jgi:hypothetical protein
MFGGIVNLRPLREALQLGLQFLEPPGDLLGKLVGIGILFVQPVELLG